jgi:GT2 family glycosyltransferase
VTSRPVLPDLTVVVPSVGRPVLRDCLQSIADGTAWPAELVLVDQSGAPAVAGCVHDLRRLGLVVTHLQRPLRGVAAARNRGIEVVGTRWLAINDDDQVVTADWLVQMHAALLTWPHAVVTGRVDGAGDGVPSTISTPTPAVHRRPLPDRDPLFAGNMGASLEVMRKVGAFDESPALNGAEDNDWGHRALRLGIPIVYQPQVAVTHLDWRTPEQVAATHGRYARAQGAFYGKHLRSGDLRLGRRAVRDIARGPWLVLRAGATRNAHLAMLGRAETRGILPGIVAGLSGARR